MSYSMQPKFHCYACDTKERRDHFGGRQCKGPQRMRCLEQHASGQVCSRPLRHDGQHVSTGSDTRYPIKVWEG